MKTKKLAILLLISFIVPFGYSQTANDVLMSIDDQKITKQEFERIYSKNKSSDVSQDDKTLDEYLDMFINYKLKVFEAKALGLDTAVRFKAELADYRKKLAKPYLIDQEVKEKLIQEAYERSKYELKASHILARVNLDAAPEDTVRAYSKIMKIRNRIIKGEAFDKVAAETSDDPTAKTNGGDLGYFTVFGMIYSFETAAFNLEAGEISMPIRTRFGYHLIKLFEKNPSKGRVQVAQIVLNINKYTPEAEKAEIEKKIFDLYREIQNGADFGSLARKNSDDKLTAGKDGVMNWMGRGDLMPDFEDQAFALRNVGDVSKPFKTVFGWHIIKLLDRKGIGSFDEEKKTIERKLSYDHDRLSISKDTKVASLKKDYQYKLNKESLEEYYRVVDQGIFNGAWNHHNADHLDKTLFILDGKEFNQKGFTKYIATNNAPGGFFTIAELIDQMYKDYLAIKVLDYEENKLNQKYPEFAHLMQEYYEGNLLYELSNQKVWTKAIIDTVGLEAFYEKNKDEYMWEERLDAVIYSCTTKDQDELGSFVNKLRKYIIKAKRKNYPTDEINEEFNKLKEEYQGSIELIPGTFSKGESKTIDQIDWEDGLSKNIQKTKSIQFVWVNQVIPPQPKKLNQARGHITADYQAYLEKEWIKELRAKYDVQINQDVLNSLK